MKNFLCVMSVIGVFLLAGNLFAKDQKALTRQLMNAIESTEPENVEDLVDRGADVNARDEEGRTPLMKASEVIIGSKDDAEEVMEIVKFLVSKGAAVNASDNKGETALLKASNVRIAKYLVSKGADIRKRNNDGQTVLMCAMIFTLEGGDALDLVKFYVEKGLDVNARDNMGKTPLMYAAENGYVKVVKYLVSEGAEVNARDKEGNTALSLAESASVKKYLRAQGAK